MLLLLRTHGSAGPPQPPAIVVTGHQHTSGYTEPTTAPYSRPRSEGYDDPTTERY